MERRCSKAPKYLEEGISVEVMDEAVNTSQSLTIFHPHSFHSDKEALTNSTPSVRTNHLEKDETSKEDQKMYFKRKVFETLIHSPRKGTMQSSRFLPPKKIRQGYNELVPLLLKTSLPKLTIDSNGILSKQAERSKATILHRPVELNGNEGHDHVVIIFPIQYQKIAVSRKKLSKLYSVYTKCSKRLASWISDLCRKQEIKLNNLCQFVSRTSRGYGKLNSQSIPESQMKMLPSAAAGRMDEEDSFMLVLEKINEVIGSMGKASNNACQSTQ